MKSLQELKDEVFKKLSQHPKIEAFFKDSLENRIALNEKWIENALVHVILGGSISQEHPLSELIEAIYADKENFEVLRNKLIPQDDYDNKMNDVLAELNGYYHLKKFGFEIIKALQEDAKQKKPDFSAELDGLYYLFEVKNLRSPVDLFNILLDKYYARKFTFPEVYSNVTVHFTPSSNWRDVRFDPKNPDDLYIKTLDWLTSIFKAIESPVNFDCNEVEPFEVVFNGDKYLISCVLEKGKSLGMIFGFKRGVCISDPLRRRDCLYPFIKKIIGKVGEGIDQLTEFDQANTRRKYLLINWQGSGEQRMFFEKECHTIVGQIDALVKSIADNLFVKLLNFDTLP